MHEKPILEPSLGLEVSIGCLYERKEYYQTMERILGDTAQWRLAAIDKQAKKLPANKEKYFREFYHPLRWLFSFPSELKSSVVISGISFLESVLVNLASDGEYYTNQPFDKPKEKILSSCRRYLNNQGNLNIPADEDWNVINNIYLLRNVLVHNGLNLGGDITEYSHEIEEIRKIVPGIEKDEDGFYFIDKMFCEKMFDSMESFLKNLKVKVTEKWE